MTQDTRAPWWHGRGEPLTPEQAQRLREDLRFWLAIGVGFVVLATAAALAGALLAQHQHPGRPARWPIVVGLVTGVVVLAATIVAVGLWFRAQHQPTRRYLISGDRRARARVGGQLRSGQPVDDQDWETARVIVEITRRQRWLPLYFVLVGVVLGVPVLLGHVTHVDQPVVEQVLRLVILLVMLSFALLTHLQRRRVLTNAARQGIDGDLAPSSSAPHRA